MVREIAGLKHISEVVTRTNQLIEDYKSGKIRPILTFSDKLNNKSGGIFPADQIVIAARPGVGKCLAKNTIVIMSDGTYKKVQDVVVNDTIMGVNSKPIRVVSTTSGIDDMYLVKQNRALDYIVNSEHILSLCTTSDRIYSRNKSIKPKLIPGGKIINVSVKDYLKLSNRKKSRLKGYKIPVNFKSRKLSIDPYHLGMWLGDGNSAKLDITTMDKEIVKYIKTIANKYNLKLRKNTKPDNKASTYSFNSSNNKNKLLNLFRHENLLNNKHIPLKYIFNSRKNRLKLLAGLIDTDGSLSHNCYDITLKQKTIIDDICYICNSLGFRTYSTKRIVEVHKGDFRTYYRLTISGNDINDIPVKIKRKKITNLKNIVNKRRTGLTVKKIGKGRYYGFELEGEDKRFFLKDFTVTHNSAFSNILVRSMIDRNMTQKVIVIYWSFEMPDYQQIIRLYSSYIGKTVKDILSSKEPLDESLVANMLKYGTMLQHYEMYFRDIPVDTEKWVDTIYKVHEKYPNYTIINLVDHTRLIRRSSEGSEENKITNLMERGVEVKNKIGCVNIFLSQLNRNIENNGARGDMGSAAPVLGDIFGSDAVSQFATLVMILHRPELYGKDVYTYAGQTISTKNFLANHIVKQRDGWTGLLTYEHNLAHNQIWDMKFKTTDDESKQIQSSDK